MLKCQRRYSHVNNMCMSRYNVIAVSDDYEAVSVLAFILSQCWHSYLRCEAAPGPRYETIGGLISNRD